MKFIVNMNYDQPFILFFQGCSLCDCRTTDDMCDEQMLKRLEENELDLRIVIYDKLPKKFTGMQDWPETTNLRCWTCDNNFISPPVFIPESIDRSTSVIGYGDISTIGNFCTWNCASRYIATYYNGNNRWEKDAMLRLMYKIMTGLDIDIIQPSPPKTIMVQYGGTITQKEYYQMIEDLNSMCTFSRITTMTN